MTKFTSEMNFQNPAFAAGCVFTLEQWLAKGGSEAGFNGLLAKGYVKEWAGQTPPMPLAVQQEEESVTVDTADTVVLDQKPLEDSEEEESAEEVTKPQGIWNWKVEDIEDLELPALNALYKDHADKYNLTVRAFSNKEALIKKMSSEA